MKRILSFLLVLFACGALHAATNIPWRLPAYSLTARSMDVREALDAFGVAEGVPVLQSKFVEGRFSGNFNNVAPAAFLDRLTTMHNLTWYYDGATLFISGAGETRTALIDLRYMKADEVMAMMRELGVEDARFPLKSASGGELIMVSGPPRYVSLVAEMIGKADKLREQRTFAEVVTRVFPLRHTWADTVSLSVSGTESTCSIRGVATLLQEIMCAGSTSGRIREGTNETGRATADERASATFGSPMIRPENRLNAVVVRDVATRMPMYEQLIRELDRPQKLVEIGVTVLEMSKDDALDWQASITAGFNDQRNENAAFLGQSAGNLLEEATGTGLTGGYSYLGDRVNVSASINALKSKGKARSVSRTSLLTLNNLAAEISDTDSYSTRLVGEKVASVSETSAGSRLTVKPRIVEPPAGLTNAVPQIWMTLELQDGGFDYLARVDDMPTKSTTLVETQAALPENHSLLIAGNFRDVEDEAGWGIPFLRDIPWIGWLFGGASSVKSRVQRLFILTPHVINMPAYGIGSTNDTTGVQLQRQRDMTEVELLEDVADRDDLIRRAREEKAKEARAVQHERFDESYERDRKESDLRKERRRIERKADHDAWQKDFDERKDSLNK